MTFRVVRAAGLPATRALLRRYRAPRDPGVGRIASMRAAWRVTFGPEPEYEE